MQWSRDMFSLKYPIVIGRRLYLPACGQDDFMCPYRGVLANECAVNEGLVLKQRIKGVEDMTLMVVPAQGVVLSACHHTVSSGESRSSIISVVSD